MLLCDGEYEDSSSLPSITLHTNQVIRAKVQSCQIFYRLDIFNLAGAQCIGPEAHRSGRDVGQRQAASHRAGRGHPLHRHHPLPA